MAIKGHSDLVEISRSRKSMHPQCSAYTSSAGPKLKNLYKNIGL
jgi:hypothetical protein